MYIKLKWPYKLEKDFQWALNKELKNLWHYVYKLPDTGYAKKPYDMIYCDRNTWITYHSELKIILCDSININKLEPQQHFYLNMLSNIRENIATVLIWSKKHNNYVELTYKKFMSMKDDKWTVKLFNIK